MDFILNFLGSTLQNSIGTFIIGSAGALTTAVAWQAAKIVYLYFKPLEPAKEFLINKFYRTGKKITAFYKLRIKDVELRNKMLSDIDESSEEIQDAFHRGLNEER